MERFALILEATILCSWIFFMTASGSSIVFNGTPGMLQPPLTRTLSMQCSLNKSGSSSSAIVGRDVTQTASDVKFVTSVVIMRNGQHVASVTQKSPAAALLDKSNIHVTGDVTGSSDKQGFLELSWQRPSQAQVGEYQCEINALTDNGHNVVFSEVIEVGITDTTVSALVNYTLSLESKLDYLLENMPRPAHTETGTIQCGKSADWKGRQGNYVLNTMTVPFSHPYDHIPVVHVGVSKFSNAHTQDTYFSVELVNVGTHNFTVQCRTWRGFVLNGLNANWISVTE